jgi:hypothetical protein
VQQGNRRRLESGATLRARVDVDADDGFTVAPDGVEAVLAKRQGKLVFALDVKTAVTLRTSRKARLVAQFANVNFWMNFKRDQSPLGRLSARVAASIDADENLRHNQSVRYSG